MLNSKIHKASAPGSLMLFGEFAVLYGKPALVMAIDQRINVTLMPRSDNNIHIKSSLGEYSTSTATITIEHPFQFILGTLKHFQTQLTTGCDIEITADFSHTIGLGSSAAVTVATMAAVFSWLEMAVSLQDFLAHALQVLQQVQGKGSGADLAAAIYGGIVRFQNAPPAVEKYATLFPFTVIYAGYKTVTRTVIQQVELRFRKQPALFRGIMDSIGECVQQACRLIEKQDWQGVGEIMNIQQGMLDSLGVCPIEMAQMIASLRQLPGISGAKISGSGMGDCMIAMGQAAEGITVAIPANMKKIAVNGSLQGVHCERK